MRLTREKTIRLSHIITDLLVASEDVEFIEDRDTIRQKTVQILQDLLKEEEAVDAEVRKKISFAEEGNPRGKRRVGRALPQILRRRDAPHGGRPPAEFVDIPSQDLRSTKSHTCKKAARVMHRTAF